MVGKRTAQNNLKPLLGLLKLRAALSAAKSALQRGISQLLASSTLKDTQKYYFCLFLVSDNPCTILYHMCFPVLVLAFLSTNTLPKQKNMSTLFTGHKLHKREFRFLEGHKIHEIPFLFLIHLIESKFIYNLILEINLLDTTNKWYSLWFLVPCVVWRQEIKGTCVVQKAKVLNQYDIKFP